MVKYVINNLMQNYMVTKLYSNMTLERIIRNYGSPISLNTQSHEMMALKTFPC